MASTRWTTSFDGATAVEAGAPREDPRVQLVLDLVADLRAYGASVGVAMRIGELSGRLGVSAATLRHYESLGLLGTPRRSPGGYRLYDDAAEERMRFILRAKALDLSLAEIRLLLELGEDDSSQEGRAAVLEMVAGKIVEVRARAKEAEAFAAQLIQRSA